MNRLGFLILSFLEKGGADDKTSAMSIREIADVDDLGCKDNTIFKKVSELARRGYVAVGYKDGRQKTFFITGEGRKILQAERG